MKMLGFAAIIEAAFFPEAEVTEVFPDGFMSPVTATVITLPEGMGVAVGIGTVGVAAVVGFGVTDGAPVGDAVGTAVGTNVGGWVGLIFAVGIAVGSTIPIFCITTARSNELILPSRY